LIIKLRNTTKKSESLNCARLTSSRSFSKQGQHLRELGLVSGVGVAVSADVFVSPMARSCTGKSAAQAGGFVLVVEGANF
jgi:hypothetical protein